MTEDKEKRGLVLNDSVDWCKASHLNLNTTETKELISDFRHDPLPLTLSRITGDQGDRGEVSWSYITEHKYSWDQGADAVFKASQQDTFLEN